MNALLNVLIRLIYLIAGGAITMMVLRWYMEKHSTCFIAKGLHLCNFVYDKFSLF